MQLIGRTNEVTLLQSYVESQRAEFIAIYTLQNLRCLT